MGLRIENRDSEILIYDEDGKNINYVPKTGLVVKAVNGNVVITGGDGVEYLNQTPEKISSPSENGLYTLVSIIKGYITGVEVSRGVVTEGDKYGYIEGLGTSVVIGNESTWVDLWAYGGKRTSPTSTFTPYMASDDAADTNREVVWEYLDANGNKQLVTVNTDGSDGRTPVSLGVTAIECSRGSMKGAFAGDVSLMTESDFTNGVPDTQSKVLCHILARDRQTQILAGRVPAGISRRITLVHVSMSTLSGNNSAILAVLELRHEGGDWYVKRPIFLSSNAPFDPDNIGVAIDPLTDYRVRIRDVSDNNTYASGFFNFEDTTV